MFRNPILNFCYIIFILFFVFAMPAFAQSEVRPQCSGSGATQRHNCFIPSVDPYSLCVEDGRIGVFEKLCATGDDSRFYVRCYAVAQCSCPSGYNLVGDMCVLPPECEAPNSINPVTGQCDYCPSGDFDPSGVCLDCPGGDCEGSSSAASSSEPICVWGVDPETGDCLPDPSSSSSGNSSAGSSSGGGSASSSGGGNSSSGNGGDDGGSGSSSPGNPVPADSTCPNKFQIGDQWYCQSNPMPSSEGQASSEGADAAAAGTCGAAPVCDGDPVGCAILLNAHFDRCNTDKTAEGGGDCSAEPACSGDPVGCSIALQNWKLRCDQHGEPVDGDADVAEYDSNFESEFGESNQASVDGEGALTHLAEVSDAVDFTSVDMSGLNINSTGRSSQCPQPRSISLSLGNFEVSYQPLCDLAEGLSTLVVLIFSYISVMLVWRSTQQG